MGVVRGPHSHGVLSASERGWGSWTHRGSVLGTRCTSVCLSACATLGVQRRARGIRALPGKAPPAFSHPAPPLRGCPFLIFLFKKIFITVNFGRTSCLKAPLLQGCTAQLCATGQSPGGGGPAFLLPWPELTALPTTLSQEELSAWRRAYSQVIKKVW